MSIESEALGAALSGVSVEEYKEAKAFVERMNHPDAGPAKQRMAKVAVAIFEEAGMQASFSYSLFDKLAAAETWYPEFDEYIEPVAKVLSEADQSGMLEKVAGPISFLKDVKDKLIGTGVIAGSMSRTVLLGALMAGVGGGAIYNTIDRSIENDTDANEALRLRAKHYRRLAGDIEDEMRRTGVAPQEAVNTVMESYEDVDG
jgi:hypothetical protein